jgi:hypothetical protein
MYENDGRAVAAVVDGELDAAGLDPRRCHRLTG